MDFLDVPDLFSYVLMCVHLVLRRFVFDFSRTNMCFLLNNAGVWRTGAIRSSTIRRQDSHHFCCPGLRPDV